MFIDTAYVSLDTSAVTIKKSLPQMYRWTKKSPVKFWKSSGLRTLDSDSTSP